MHIPSWKWGKEVPPKHWYISTKCLSKMLVHIYKTALHQPQKTAGFVVTTYQYLKPHINCCVHKNRLLFSHLQTGLSKTILVTELNFVL
jgi:hypothetical protein